MVDYGLPVLKFEYCLVGVGFQVGVGLTMPKWSNQMSNHIEPIEPCVIPMQLNVFGYNKFYIKQKTMPKVLQIIGLTESVEQSFTNF